MKPALETAIADAVSRGVCGITLYPTGDGRWQAAATTDRVGWSIAFDADPAEAIRLVLGGKPVTPPAIDEDVFG
jgi:hypothetical protein